MRILVCAATSFEAEACRKGIRSVHRDGLITVLQTGIGLAKASLNLKKWLAHNHKPDLIVSTGFAGTIENDLEPGTWVLGTEIYQWRHNERPWLVECISPLEIKKVARERAHPCRLVSAQELIDYSKSTAALRKDLGPGLSIVVDMESAALAVEAACAGVRFMALRMVTDGPKSSLPSFVYEFSKALGSSVAGPRSSKDRLGFFIKGTTHAISRPSSVIKLIKNSRKWGDELSGEWRRLASCLTKPEYETDFPPRPRLDRAEIT